MYLYAYIYIYIYMSIYVYMCEYVYVDIYMRIYLYISIYHHLLVSLAWISLTSLAIRLHCPILPEGLLGYIVCPYRAVVDKL